MRVLSSISICILAVLLYNYSSIISGVSSLILQSSKYYNTVFEQKGDSVVAEVKEDATEDARFILVAGLPLDQPIVQYGPFVLNSQEEAYQAMMDYQTFSNGFERANKGWESEIGKNMQ